MARTTIFREQQLTGFQFYDYLGLYVLGVNPAPFTLTEGEEYTVFWDGAEYTCTCQQIEGMGLAIGNWSGTGTEPFIIGWSETGVSFFSLDANPHTAAIYQGEAEEEEEDENLIGTGAELLVRSGTLTAIAKAIRRKTGKTDPIPLVQMPAEIVAITSDGGSSADVRYVTFMNYDGSVEYGKKAVAVGDDCANPIVRGLFDTPTRESTGQYNYTFAGWSTVAGGGLNSNALKAVTDNRVVYANFAAVVRYYTITYYDADGVTVLKTESLAYGAKPSYIPQKAGYTFTGWTPEFAVVAGDAAYYAGWIEKMDFSSLTWEQISGYCQNGNPAELFEIGASKQVTFKSYRGSTFTATAQIVGFHHDDLADGSGKAPITLRLIGFLPDVGTWHSGGTAARNIIGWGSSEVRSAMRSNDGRNTSYGLPSDLNAIIKPVTKMYYDIANNAYATSEDTVFLPSVSELGFEIDGRDEGACYEAFSSGKSSGEAYDELVYTNQNGDVVNYWTRTRSGSGTIYSISPSGALQESSQSDASHYYRLGYICIG